MKKYKDLEAKENTEFCIYIMIKPRTGFLGSIKDNSALNKIEKYAKSVIDGEFFVKRVYKDHAFVKFINVRNINQAIDIIDDFIINNVSVLDHYIADDPRAHWFDLN